MLGNVNEWTATWYRRAFQRNAPDVGTSRVLRGGSWGNYPSFLRSSARRNDQDVKSPYIGVRLARSP